MTLPQKILLGTYNRDKICGRGQMLRERWGTVLKVLSGEKQAAVRMPGLKEPSHTFPFLPAANQTVIDSEEELEKLREAFHERFEQFLFDDYSGEYTRILFRPEGHYFAVTNRLLPRLCRPEDRLFYLDESPLHGLGTFAALPLTPGQAVDTALVLSGRQAGTDIYARTALGRFVNMQPPQHANATLEKVPGGDLVMVALRPIQAGEEILVPPYEDTLKPFAPLQVVPPEWLEPLQLITAG